MSSQHLCECGCGKPTSLAARNDRRHGHVKGQPLRFIKGHHRSEEKAPKSCSIDGCDKPARGRGWCLMHYGRWERNGDPERTVFVAKTGCQADGCDGAHAALGYCAKHYTRILRHGNLLGIHPNEPAETRFWMRVDKSGECWTWTAARGDHGYGSFTDDDGRSVSAHRFSHQLHYGPIPKGLVVCHKCDNPPCVRPDHLFLGTQADNVRDMQAKGRAVSGWAIRTHCSNGHPYDEENTRVDKHGHRRCRACAREWAKKAAQQKKAGEK